MTSDENHSKDSWDTMISGNEPASMTPETIHLENTASQTPPAEKNPQTILLVDDDPLIIRMYQRKFSQDGYHVLTAFNGAEALAILHKEKPDMIFLDVMMPKMNGVETLKALKEDSKTKDIPVIMLTNLGDRPEDIEKAKQMGAHEYLVKSQVNLKDLTAMVKKIIGT